jgi:hypothetical protein
VLKTTNINDELAAADIRAALLNKRCWYGYAGIGSTFAIDLGRKIQRDPKEAAFLSRRSAKGRSEESVRHVGESHLLVWCSWRIDDEKGPVASSDNEIAVCDEAIKRLVGKTVRRVEIGRGWDVRMEFSGGLAVSLFPDHVGPEASIDTNWELWRPERAYFIGDDLNCEVTDRQNRPLRPAGRWQVRDEAQRAKE